MKELIICDKNYLGRSFDIIELNNKRIKISQYENSKDSCQKKKNLLCIYPKIRQRIKFLSAILYFQIP